LDPSGGFRFLLNRRLGLDYLFRMEPPRDWVADERAEDIDGRDETEREEKTERDGAEERGGTEECGEAEERGEPRVRDEDGARKGE